MKFPENVFEASTSIEWYLDIWGGSGITVAGKYGEDTDKGKNAMTVVDCGEYKVFYADFTKKFLGKNQQYAYLIDEVRHGGTSILENLV